MISWTPPCTWAKLVGLSVVWALMSLKKTSISRRSFDFGSVAEKYVPVELLWTPPSTLSIMEQMTKGFTGRLRPLAVSEDIRSSRTGNWQADHVLIFRKINQECVYLDLLWKTTSTKPEIKAKRVFMFCVHKTGRKSWGTTLARIRGGILRAVTNS